jgi:SAM-dependent methyltransferase
MPHRATGALARCEAGLTSRAVALMELLIETEDTDAAAASLRAHAATSPVAAGILELLESKAEGAARVAAMLRSGMDCPPVDATAEEGIEFCRRLFDWSVGESEEASVALYSLGDASILAAATAEIVEWLDGEDALGLDRDVLDIGCGIGRMEVALAGRVRAILGTDVSPEMLGRARVRCAGLSNVQLATATGRDLATHPSESFDLVIAVDVFPYLVQSALSLAATHVSEAGRVLRPGGQLVILNFSYRGKEEEDVADVTRFAAAAGLDVLVGGVRPFTLWDGLAFRLRRRI